MKRNLLAFLIAALAAAPIVATLAAPNVASAAKWKRYSASSLCMANDNNLNLGTGGSFTGNTPHVRGTGTQTVICALPSDSTFNHVNTDLVNVHVRRVAAYDSGWWFGVRVCVQSYGGYTNYCNDAKAVPSAIGEHTMSMTGGYLNYIRNTSYQTWGPYVYTWFKSGDLVRFIYQTFDA